MQKTDFKHELKTLLKEHFGKPLDSLASIEELAGLLQISTQTLRRFLGKIKTENGNGVSSKTLSVICRYVGYEDWDDFQENYNDERGKTERDKAFIEHMGVFFKNGEKHNLDYYQNTITVDTLNDYVQVIYANRRNITYAKQLHGNNIWASDYVLAYLPNYNYFGQDWFRTMLRQHIKLTRSAFVRLALNNYLCLGAFFAKRNVKYTPGMDKLKRSYADYKKAHHYMGFVEMRYLTHLLFEAKSKNNTMQFARLLAGFLDDLQKENISEFNQQELIIFLSNTLIWMQEYGVAYELLKSRTKFITRFDENCARERSLHYFGINMAFVKTTFALTWVTNGLDELPMFELSPTDFGHPNGLLYNDFIRLMYLAKCILTERGAKHKKKLYEELKTLADKTNYTRIYDVLKDFEESPYQQ